MKTLVFTLFAVIFVASGHLTVVCGGDNVGETIGFVAEISGDVLYVVGEPLNERGFASVLVCVSDAPVYDLRTGFRTGASAIKTDTDVRVAYDLWSGEPHPAVVVWLNWSDESAAAFTVLVGDNIVNGGDTVVFLCANEKYRVAITDETMILDPYGGLLSPADIVPGMEFFVWTDMITASSPALVFPEKVVVVH